ncbi:hypothetical protein SAMN04488518_10541 [Pseudovibrio ascidiaceicola]|uniref:Uncharacterized protein n=1 Tax=Pseudovibrio ascidiaceicola TaxID=285279 RepID=A0A1I3ZDE6_9HYPH|nr:hypothetical protein SAMN04488518_10541 [Pseudovibrio ascidiaceicola]
MSLPVDTTTLCINAISAAKYSASRNSCLNIHAVLNYTVILMFKLLAE